VSRWPASYTRPSVAETGSSPAAVFASNLDTPVAVDEEARRYRLESPHEAAIIYAGLDVDVVVGGFEKRHFDFVPGVARAPTIGLRLCKLSNDVGGRPLGPGESLLRQQLAQLCFCHFLSRCGIRLVCVLIA